MIDRAQALAFVDALTGAPNTPVTFQTFDDRDEKQFGPKRKHLSNVIIGTVDQHIAILSKLNDAGAGVFIQINEGRRGIRNVTALRALFVDDDGKSPLPPLFGRLRPQMITQSSTTSDRNRHFYFLLRRGEAIERFTPAQKQLINFFNTDKSIHNLDRVMRLPGSHHRKDPGRPRPVALYHLDDEIRRYSIDEILAAYPIAPAQQQALLIEAQPEVFTEAALATAARISTWLSERSVQHVQLSPVSFRLARCVFNPAHGDKMKIAVQGRGGVWAGCWHDSCFDDKTEVLTRNGFVPFAKVTDETEIATRHATGRLEYHRPTARQRYDYKGKLLHFKGRSVDLCVTPDHALFTRASHKGPFRRVVAATARKQSCIYFSRHTDWKGRERATYRLPSVRGTDGRHLERNNGARTISMDAWLALLGWYIAEGSLSKAKRNYTVVITQKSRRTRRKIIAITERAGFHANHNGRNVRICSKQLYEHLRGFGHAADKFVPREILRLSKRQLAILFDAAMAGDGDRDRARYTTVSRQLADDMQEIALKLGIGATITAREKSRAGKTIFRVHLGRTKHRLERHNVHEVDYEGEVFDVTVPNHVLMVRRNGRVCWSGNCGGNRNRWADIKDAIGGWLTGNAGFTRGDEVELARRLIADLGAASEEPLVHAEGALRRYSKETGLWDGITEEEQARALGAYAGATVGSKKVLNLSTAIMNGTMTMTARFSSSPEFFRAPPPGISFANGFLAVTPAGSAFMPHSPDHRQLVGLPFGFDPERRAPRWERYLAECFAVDNDAPAKAMLLQEFLGGCLIGVAQRYQKALMLSGDGNNGKSVFTKIALKLFPESMRAAIKPQEFGDDYSRAALVGVRLNCVAEIPESDILSSDSFKAFITSDAVMARNPYGRKFMFTPQAGHIFAANRLPGTNDHSSGFWRRFVVIPWNRVFSGADRDENLDGYLIEHELPGIAAWAVRGAERLLEQGHYTEPPSSIEALRVWRLEVDQVAVFAEAALEPDNASEPIAFDVIYDTLCDWLERYKHKPMTPNAVARRLRALGFIGVGGGIGSRYQVRLKIEPSTRSFLPN